tara:strand:- start:730 stop:2211 length:1482 start_codon:yes stop_codon:yes gene_type:complete
MYGRGKGGIHGSTLSRDAFISVMAGYHISKPRGKDTSIGRKVSARSTTSDVLLYRYGPKDGKHGARAVGTFIGNRVYYRYANTVAKIDSDLHLHLKSKGGRDLGDNLNGSDILARFVPQLVDAVVAGANTKLNLKPDKVDVASEQLSSLGMTQKPRAGGGEAQPVDVTTRGGEHYQVTFKSLSEYGHHGIYGESGKTLNQDIRRLEKKYKDSGRNRRGMYQKMANKGLRYFQDRLPVWNKHIDMMQKKKPNKTRNASGLRTALDFSKSGRMDVSANGRMDINRASRKAYGRMVRNSTGNFTKGADTITRTALGNMSEFGQGVSYTFQLGPYHYTHLSKFQMMKNLRWKETALNKALVVESHDALTDILAIESDGLDKSDVTMRQFQSQIAYEVTKSTDEIETMTLLNHNTSKLITSTGRVYPSIDMIQADQNFSRHVRDVVAPEIEAQFKSNSHGDLGNKLGQPREHRTNGVRFWAMPYISIADYDIRRHGID